ncbi:hypothetical protein ACMAZE_10565 [Pseudopelagicola sp. nBUS_20]|uniref:hypothetical protein n=1 Tax=Pseudopelagicola sp. nBUS_20 TaxID=3395317 RepID=UPI003EB89D35
MSKLTMLIGLILTVLNIYIFNNDLLLLVSMSFMASVITIVSPILLLASLVFVLRGQILFGFLGLVFALTSFFTAPGILFLVDVLGFKGFAEFIESIMILARLGAIIS